MEFIENIEPNIDLFKLEYHGNGETTYADGRQVLVRAVNDALVSYPNDKGERGIILIKRKSEPAKGYLWCFGGGIEKGVPIINSLTQKIKLESGLDILNPTLLTIERLIWGNSPNNYSIGKGLPGGIDDLGILFYCDGHGELNLDKLHELPMIVTPEMYTSSFKEQLHPYIRRGMDLAIPHIKSQ